MGAQLSNIYPSLSLTPDSFTSNRPGSAQTAKTTQTVRSEAAFFNLAFSSDFRHSLWPLAPANFPDLPPVPPGGLPESKEIPLPEISARSALAANKDGCFFYQKNPDQKLPVASLTKILTALVATDSLDTETIAFVSKNAVETYGEMGGLVIDEKISVKNLLYIMLMDSSNDAATAVAEAVEKNTGADFVGLMNAKAKKLKMANSSFSDPAGLNPDNISTAIDLSTLTNAAIENQLIKQIIGIQEIDVFSDDKKIRHHLKNTNRLFGKINNVAGGKTGYTEEAGECMILVVDSPQNNSYFTVIVLGADIGARFAETEKLVRWTKYTYGW